MPLTMMEGMEVASADADSLMLALAADALRLVAGGHQDGVVHRRAQLNGS